MLRRAVHLQRKALGAPRAAGSALVAGVRGGRLAHGPGAAMATPLVIAIDGPAASGKGTLARRLAERLHLAYLDTGLLYRAVAWQVEPARSHAGAAAVGSSTMSTRAGVHDSLLPLPLRLFSLARGWTTSRSWRSWPAASAWPT